MGCALARHRVHCCTQCCGGGGDGCGVPAAGARGSGLQHGGRGSGGGGGVGHECGRGCRHSARRGRRAGQRARCDGSISGAALGRAVWAVPQVGLRGWRRATGVALQPHGAHPHNAPCNTSPSAPHTAPQCSPQHCTPHAASPQRRDAHTRSRALYTLHTLHAAAGSPGPVAAAPAGLAQGPEVGCVDPTEGPCFTAQQWAAFCAIYQAQVRRGLVRVWGGCRCARCTGGEQVRVGQGAY